ncbi:hypothetical protein D3C85_1558280 [compost metagenome]
MHCVACVVVSLVSPVFALDKRKTGRRVGITDRVQLFSTVAKMVNIDAYFMPPPPGLPTSAEQA